MLHRRSHLPPSFISKIVATRHYYNLCRLLHTIIHIYSWPTLYNKIFLFPFLEFRNLLILFLWLRQLCFFLHFLNVICTDSVLFFIMKHNLKSPFSYQTTVPVRFDPEIYYAHTLLQSCWLLILYNYFKLKKN